jgi:RimJ/RimL family protein N-acetyltransferase
MWHWLRAPKRKIGTFWSGGGRYIVSEPGKAEMAFMTVEAWQGRGVGSILMRHLIMLGRTAGLQEFTAEVLPENIAMRRIFTKFGFKAVPRKDPQIISLSLKLEQSVTHNPEDEHTHDRHVSQR